MEMTLFKKCNEIQPSGTMSLHDLCMCIRRGAIRVGSDEIDLTSTIATLRTEPDKEKRKAIKQHLPAVIVSGEFSERNAGALVNHSRLMVIDIDGDAQHDGFDLHATIDAMKNYGKYFRLVCLSPSGNGIKIIAEHLHDPEQHKQVFQAIASEIEQTFDVVVDQSGKDIARLMFLTIDVNAWIDPKYPAMSSSNMAYRNEAIMHPEQIEPKKRKSSKITANVQRSEGMAMMDNQTMLDAICDAVRTQGIDITSHYEDWVKIAFGIACEFGETGRNAFHIISQNYPRYDVKECDAQYDDALKNHSGDATFGSVVHIAKQHRIRFTTKSKTNDKTTKTNDRTGKAKDSFWYLKNDNVRIDEVQLYQLFKSNGITLMRLGAKHSDEKPAPLILVEINRNVVKRINAEYLRNFVKSYLDSIDVDDDILHQIRNAVSKGASTLFSEDKWPLHFDVIEHPKFMRETFDTGYIFFKSAFMEIKKDGKTIKPYNDANGLVWSEWRINRTCRMMHPEDYQSHDYLKFLQVVCTPHNDAPLHENRFDALRWSIGCLMHNPQTTARKVLIHFCEDNAHMHMASNGGTGKDLISYESIKRIRKVNKVSYTRGVAKGRTSFPLQEVSASTQVIHYGDVDKSYLQGSFAEDVFDNVTGGITIERKREHPIRIEPEDAPRLVSTGNAVPFVHDESTKRRFYLMEIYSRFNADFTPEDMFGRRFFEEQWNGDDWSAFFNIMGDCIQFFIANPERPTYNSESLKLNQFRTNTHPEWNDFINAEIDKFFKHNTEAWITHQEKRFDAYKIYDGDSMLYMDTCDETFSKFRKHCREKGAKCDNVRHQDINRWMDLTVRMLDAQNDRWLHSYVHRKISKEAGKTYHFIWRCHPESAPRPDAINLAP